MKKKYVVLLVSSFLFNAEALSLKFVEGGKKVQLTQIDCKDIVSGECSSDNSKITLNLTIDRKFIGLNNSGKYEATFQMYGQNYVVQNAQAAMANAQQEYAKFLALTPTPAVSAKEQSPKVNPDEEIDEFSDPNWDNEQ